MSRLKLLFPLLLLVYLVIGTLYAVRTPDWQAPDEPAHYNYIAQLATNGCCPILEVGDWDKPYLDRLTGAQFAPELLDQLDAVQYEDHQPPLYYLFSSVVYRFTGGSLLALRLFSVVIGAGVVAAAYAVARTLLSQPLALAAAALVAFIPQHVSVLASVNNDGISELAVGLTLLATIYYLRGSAPKWLGWITLLILAISIVAAASNGLGTGGVALMLFLVLAVFAAVSEFTFWDWVERGHNVRAETWLLGMLVGIGLLTKVNTAFLAGVVPLMIILRWWMQRRDSDIDLIKQQQFRHLIKALTLFFIPVIVLGGIWWVRNVEIYGMPDFLGLARHDLVVTDQPRTADQIETMGFGEYVRKSLTDTFTSFWGQFGWMALPLYDYAPLFLGFIALAVSGWAVRWRIKSHDETGKVERWQTLSWTLLTLTFVFAILQYLYYNTEFYQMQGRYLFPLLIPLGMVVALGLDGWRRLLFGERVSAQWMVPCVVLLFVPLNLYLVWRVLPLLAPAG